MKNTIECNLCRCKCRFIIFYPSIYRIILYYAMSKKVEVSNGELQGHLRELNLKLNTNFDKRKHKINRIIVGMSELWN